MKKLVLFFLTWLAYTSIYASEVRLTNGVSFDMPEGYEYFKHKTYPYSAKRGNDVLYLSAIYGDKFDKTVFYTSADTMFYNLSRANMEREEHYKIWKFSKKYVKRYYKLSKDSYAVTYSCHTESKAGFVMLATYSTTKQLNELEDMFDSIKIAHKNSFRAFGYTFINGGWLIILLLFVMFAVLTLVPIKLVEKVEMTSFTIGIGLAIYIWWAATWDIMLMYLIGGGLPIYLLWQFVEDYIPYRKNRYLKSNKSGNDSGDDGGDDGGDEGNDDNGYVTSDDGSYYTPIDF